jgi:hypothetical protein
VVLFPFCPSLPITVVDRLPRTWEQPLSYRPAWHDNIVTLWHSDIVFFCVQRAYILQYIKTPRVRNPWRLGGLILIAGWAGGWDGSLTNFIYYYYFAYRPIWTCLVRSGASGSWNWQGWFPWLPLLRIRSNYCTAIIWDDPFWDWRNPNLYRSGDVSPLLLISMSGCPILPNILTILYTAQSVPVLRTVTTVAAIP